MIKEGIRIDCAKIMQVVQLRGIKQLGTIQEEAGELIFAMATLSELVSVWMRSYSGSVFFIIDQSLMDNIKEEIADAYVTMENVKTLLGISDEVINQQFVYKRINPSGEITADRLPMIMMESNELIKALSMLIQAVAKWSRVTSGDNYLVEQVVKENLITRMAHVYGLLKNIMTLLGITPEEINEQIKYKQDRLAKKIDEGKITA